MTGSVRRLKWNYVVVVSVVICLVVRSVNCDQDAENETPTLEPEVGVHSDAQSDEKNSPVAGEEGQGLPSFQPSINQEILTPSDFSATQQLTSSSPTRLELDTAQVAHNQLRNHTSRGFQRSEYFAVTFHDNNTAKDQQPSENPSAEGAQPISVSTQNETHKSYSFSFSNSNSTAIDWNPFDGQSGIPHPGAAQPSFSYQPPQMMQQYPIQRPYPYFYQQHPSGFQQNQAPLPPPEQQQMPASGFAAEQSPYGNYGQQPYQQPYPPEQQYQQPYPPEQQYQQPYPPEPQYQQPYQQGGPYRPQRPYSNRGTFPFAFG